MYLLLGFILVLILIKIFSKLTLGRCVSPVCLVGKTALITGGNSGLGLETALALAGRGCRVIIADKDDCTKSTKEIKEKSGNTNVVAKLFDLASLASVRKLAQDINQNERKLDILVNNAGASAIGNSYTNDGIHIGMQVNHYGAFLLTHLLVGLLKKSGRSRIIFVSSAAAYTVFAKKLIFPKDVIPTIFSEWLVYSNSKLCNIITANLLAKKLEGTGVTVNSLHPGLVATQIVTNYFRGITSYKWQEEFLIFLYKHFIRSFLKNAEEGAQTIIYLAVSKDVENVSGKFFVDCQPFLVPYQAKNFTYAAEVWKTSEKLVKLTSEEKL